LHDCGKVTTPVHVVDKATKLETIFDRINLVDARFEVLKRDMEIEALKRKLALTGSKPTAESAQIDRDLQEGVRALEDDREFLRHANVGGEVMSSEAQDRVRQIGTGRKWVDVSGKPADFLTQDEAKNLTI